VCALHEQSNTLSEALQKKKFEIAIFF